MFKTIAFIIYFGVIAGILVGIDGFCKFFEQTSIYIIKQELK